MSAAQRVARAAETIRARWERQVSTDPQTEAAQALEDTGQLLDPEVAAELVAFRALELGDPDGRVSAACGDSAHPTWLRSLNDLRGCPWCRVAALLAERHETNEALDDAVRELRARQSCPCPPADQPGPHQVGCLLAEAPSPLFPTVAALREASSREEPHDSPLHRPYTTPHDLDMPATGGGA